MKQLLPVVSQTTHENLLPNRFHFAVQQIPLRSAAKVVPQCSRFFSVGQQIFLSKAADGGGIRIDGSEVGVIKSRSHLSLENTVNQHIICHPKQSFVILSGVFVILSEVYGVEGSKKILTNLQYAFERLKDPSISPAATLWMNCVKFQIN